MPEINSWINDARKYRRFWHRIDDKRVPDLYAFARAFSRDFNVITLLKSERMFLYRDGIYVEKVKAYVKKASYGIFGTYINSYKLREIFNFVHSLTYKDEDFFQKKDNINLLNFKNCVYDIESKKVLKHNPFFYQLIQLPHNYNPDSKCPRFKQFICEVFPYPEDRIRMCEWIGYSFYRRYDLQHKALFLFGSGGNGRSTLLKIWAKILGEKNVSSKKLHQLCYDRFSKAKLYKKFANISTETPSKSLTNTDDFKALTGVDLIDAEFKGQDSFQFWNYAKLVFSANVLPEFVEKTYAVDRRIDLMETPNTFKEGIEPDLDKKLESEIEGIIILAIEGLRRLIENRKFTERYTVEEISTRYRAISNSVKYFVENFCIEDSDAKYLNSEFYRLYYKVCQERDIEPVTRHSFLIQLHKLQDDERIISPSVELSVQDFKLEGKRCIIGLKVNV
jgi:putative DNA primase/helicase